MNPAATLAPELLGQLPDPLRLAVSQLATQNQSLLQENQLLRQKLEALIRRYFGSPKSESVDPHQLQLLLAGLTLDTPVAPAPATQKSAKAAKAPAARNPARTGFPENLPVERVVLIPEEVQAQPEAFRQIEEVITKELDYEPGRFFWRHWVRPKFVRRNPAASAAPLSATSTAPVLPVATVVDPPEVWIASLPNRLIEKGMPGVALLTHVILSRFADHLPYYRLEKIFRERHQVRLARQSMMDWTEKTAQWLLPIWRQMKQDLLAGGYLQADETPIWYLDREVPGRCRQGYFWVYSKPNGEVIFEWRTSRGREGPQEFLKDFHGCLQCDGYQVYQSLAAERSDWKLFFCWAHARRKLIEAQKHDRRAAWLVHQIGLLYDLERRLREQKAGPARRQAARSAEAKMVLRRIGQALDRLQPKVLPQSLLGQAIGYITHLWPGLVRYTGHGEVEIDSNQVENSIRPTAIGKKNFLFVGHPEAGWRSAVIYSILGTCHRYGINPAQYLQDVLKRLPDMKQSEIPTVTPKAWAKAHPEARMIPVK